MKRKLEASDAATAEQTTSLKAKHQARRQAKRNAQYPYRPLTKPDEIRVLVVKRGSPASPLVCKIRHVDIHSTFDAMSYAWGESKGNLRIGNREEVVKVPSNLLDALLELRSPTKDMTVWADAVCIDQNDDVEKGHQVRFMSRIYKRAGKVVVWLGKDDDCKAERVFELASAIARKQVQDIPPPGDPLWQDVAFMFRQEWFYRLWCFQEIVLASAAEVHWGSSRIPWSLLGYTAAWVRSVGYRLCGCITSVGLYNAHIMDRAREFHCRTSLIQFSSLMALTRRLRASDPKDRVYALLGLPTSDADPEKGDFYMRSNYDISTYEVYQRLAQKEIERSQDLMILSAVQHGPFLDHAQPSWIPQWNRFFTYSLIPSTTENRFNASANLAKQPPGVQGRLLVASGLEFDKVSSTSADYLPGANPLRTEVWRVEELWKLVLSYLPQAPRNVELAEAFCWTVTAGTDWHGAHVEKGSMSHLADFAAFQQIHFEKPILDGREQPENSDGLPDGPEHPERFIEAFANACGWRRLFVTERGFIGIGPACSRKGDSVCILSGSTVPIMPRVRGKHHKVVGEAYVHGIMYGEACQEQMADSQQQFSLS